MACKRLVESAEIWAFMKARTKQEKSAKIFIMIFVKFMATLKYLFEVDA
jgi:hypothetical protein